jgi:C4-type Zn-finger protein
VFTPEQTGSLYTGTLAEVEPTTDRNHPVSCPECKAQQGHAVRVTTIKGEAAQVAIDMQCHACHHRWQDIVGFAEHPLVKGIDVT